MKSFVKKYRLRIQSRIVGYAEDTPNGMLFRGKEALWWMRGKPNYDQVDEAIGIQDCLRRDVYEMDIVSYRINDALALRKGIVLWENRKKMFGVYDVESQHFCQIFIQDLCLFKTDKIEIVSHLFNHPKLEEKLGLKNL